MKSILVISILFFIACAPSFESKRLYFKEIRNPDIHIEWFYYSLIGNTTPQYVIANDVKNGVCDTICEADNIKDVFLKEDTIFLLFNGKPTQYGVDIEMPANVYNYTIQMIKDTLVDVSPKKTYTKQ